MAEPENSSEKRLVELETKIAFQDHIIDDLNGVIILQQEQIDRIEKDLVTVRDQLKIILSGSVETDGT